MKFLSKIDLPQSQEEPSLNIPSGNNIASPSIGDIWNENGDLKFKSLDSIKNITSPSHTQLSNIDGITIGGTHGHVVGPNSITGAYLKDDGSWSSPTGNVAFRSFNVITTSIEANQLIASLDASLYRTAEFLIEAINTTEGKYHSTKILAIQNGITATHTEYGYLNIGGIAAYFNVIYSNSSMKLVTTPTSTTPTNFKVTILLSKI